MHVVNTLALSCLLPQLASAFPWALEMARSANMDAQGLAAAVKKRVPQTTCPIHTTRQGAAPYSSYYPSAYTGAKNGLPGNGKGGVLVPAAGDTAHAYVPPSSTDLRGPCPGLNTLANHNFISHDGITTFTEMVDAAQNVYNWRHDLASFVATTGVVQDGDILTGIMSIGCTGGLSTSNTGLQTHNKFEADASMARTDTYLSPDGDAYTVNGTLFGEMIDTCASQGFSAECMGVYTHKRWQESLETNGNFFNGPFTFFVSGTSLLPLNSFANFKSGTPDPAVANQAAFWGVSQDSNGKWTYNRNETFPKDWYNRPSAYPFPLIVEQIFAQYAANMNPLGGNTGKPNTFVGLNYPGFVQNGALTNASPQGVACLLYQVLAGALPTSLLQTLTVSAGQQSFVKKYLGDYFASDFGCPA